MTNIFKNFLLGGLYEDKELEDIFCDNSYLESILFFESSLAKVQAELGIIPKSSANAIRKKLRKITREDIKYLSASNNDGVIIPKLIKYLKDNILFKRDAEYLHWGVSSQDVIDSVQSLQLHKFINLLDKRLKSFIELGVEKALAYKNMPVAARTRGQIATVTSFGAKLSSNFLPILNQRIKLLKAKSKILQLSLGGSSGNLIAFGEISDDLARFLAEELNLYNLIMPWHNNREGFLELTSILTATTASFGKFGADVLSMTQSELGELEVSEPGSSSVMPHKKNPIRAEALIAIADLNSILNSAMSSSMVHRNERDGVAWTKEILVLPQIACAAAVSCKQALILLSNIVPNEDNMARTIKMTNGLIFSERAVYELAKSCGKSEAERVVSEAVRRVSLKKSHLSSELKISFGEKEELAKIFDPAGNLGEAPDFVERFCRRAKEKNL